MKSYISETDSMHYIYGDDTEAVLRTMAYRFMGNHPPMPFLPVSYTHLDVYKRQR